MSGKFKSGREDGRSNVDVIVDLFKNVPDSTIFTFDEMVAALNEGGSREFNRRDLSSLIAKANRKLLNFHRCVLYCVAGVGYQRALPEQHNQLALRRQSKAELQIEEGVRTIKQVRWDEMDENSRNVTQGTLMILSGVQQMMRRERADAAHHRKTIEERYTRQETAIEELFRIVGAKKESGELPQPEGSSDSEEQKDRASDDETDKAA